MPYLNLLLDAMGDEDKDSGPRFPAITKNMPITIHASLLVALIVMVWVVAGMVSSYESRLNQLEIKAKYRWSSQMEEDVWDEFIRDPTKKPDFDRIRKRYKYFLEDE